MSGGVSDMELKTELEILGGQAKAAARKMAVLSTVDKNKALHMMADRLEMQQEKILSANAVDMEAGKSKGLTAALLDRLRLTPERITGMAEGLRQVAALPDPVGFGAFRP